MRLRFQGLKNPAAVATTAGMLIDGHISDLGFVRIVQVQSATGDGLAGRIEKQEVKSGFFSRIALAPARKSASADRSKYPNPRGKRGCEESAYRRGSP